MIKTLNDLEKIKQDFLNKEVSRKFKILVCGGGGCVGAGCEKVIAAVKKALKELRLDGQTWVYETGCIGSCAVGPLMVILPQNIFYANLTAENVKPILEAHMLEGKVLEQHTFFDPILKKHIPDFNEIPFYKHQVKIALRNCGAIDYRSIDNYIAVDGYKAIAKALRGMSRQQVVDEIKESGLQGRGGGGFPTGVKWQAGLKADSKVKYIVCNADEGDPGAFMDRSIIEGDPHGLIEGMMLGGYAIDAKHGFVYVRAEYPLAIERLEAALKQARKYGLLGKNILGSGFDFDLEIRIGAGAFVCGEETSLMNSIEGQRGEPRQKPPYPFQRGLFGMPTIINNVETFVNCPAIILKGAKWYASFGSEKSKGTKVFCLAGDIENTGIVEVPIGTPLRKIIYDIGGGLPGGGEFKAAQIGGPSGGCITKQNIDTPIDFQELTKLGAMMGSGGLIVMGNGTCMVDTARFFMEFIQDESCGKCVACRIGTKRMLETLEKLTEGKGKAEHIEELKVLGHAIKEASLCGLGQTAANPVLSTIDSYACEYAAHITDKKCPAGVCKNLISFKINEKCKGCSLCKRACPADAIIGEVGKPETWKIDLDKCTKCGLCMPACKFKAIDRL